jgi:hypothetical protein
MRDGSGRVAPRMAVQLLANAKESQSTRNSLHLTEYAGDELFERISLIDAIREMCIFRLRTLVSENPWLDGPIQALRGGRSSLSGSDLSSRWKMSPNEMRECSERLRLLGFFDDPLDGAGDQFRISPLYQPALAIVDWRNMLGET